VASVATVQAQPAANTARFVLGAAAGLVAHESGHLATGLAFNAHPFVRRVEFHGIPFFAITHATGPSPRHEFIISSAGFWTQHATSELLLTRHPRLWQERRWVDIGVIAFGIGTSLSYAGAAWARTGPIERDTRSMSTSLGVSEPAIGTMVLVPALLDSYRVWRPNARWAVWGSRAAKTGFMFLALKPPAR
jgi:hypothetical protein